VAEYVSAAFRNELLALLHYAILFHYVNRLIIYYFCYHRPNKQTADEAQGWMGYLTKAVTASATYLPSQVTDVFTQGRAIACVHLPFQGLKNVCAITV